MVAKFDLKWPILSETRDIFFIQFAYFYMEFA